MNNSPTPKGFVLKTARDAVDFNALATLYREYAAWLQIDAAFPHLEEEMAGLPGEYAPPCGELILAVNRSTEAIGCVAIRALQDAGNCEMKRLYVRPTSRSSGVGHALVEAAVIFAVSAGYRVMKLDTLPSMTGAIAIYRSLGFEETQGYYASPGQGALYFQKRL